MSHGRPQPVPPPQPIPQPLPQIIIHPSLTSQTPCCHAMLRTPTDAITILESVRQGLLPRCSRRLTGNERGRIGPGSVWVWEEEETNMRRWTDGRRWGASRVGGGGFLIYREMEGGGGRKGSVSPSLSPPPPRASSRPNNNPYQPEPVSAQAAQYWANPPDPSSRGNSTRRHDGLVKQTYSTSMNSPNGGTKKFHVVAYYSKNDQNLPPLPAPHELPQLQGLIVPSGIWADTTERDRRDGGRSAGSSSAGGNNNNNNNNGNSQSNTQSNSQNPNNSYGSVPPSSLPGTPMSASIPRMGGPSSAASQQPYQPYPQHGMNQHSSYPPQQQQQPQSAAPPYHYAHPSYDMYGGRPPPPAMYAPPNPLPHAPPPPGQPDWTSGSAVAQPALSNATPAGLYSVAPQSQDSAMRFQGQSSSQLDGNVQQQQQQHQQDRNSAGRRSSGAPSKRASPPPHPHAHHPYGSSHRNSTGGMPNGSGASGPMSAGDPGLGGGSFGYQAPISYGNSSAVSTGGTGYGPPSQSNSSYQQPQQPYQASIPHVGRHDSLDSSTRRPDQSYLPPQQPMYPSYAQPPTAQPYSAQSGGYGHYNQQGTSSSVAPYQSLQQDMSLQNGGRSSSNQQEQGNGGNNYTLPPIRVAIENDDWKAQEKAQKKAEKKAARKAKKAETEGGNKRRSSGSRANQDGDDSHREDRTGSADSQKRNMTGEDARQLRELGKMVTL